MLIQTSPPFKKFFVLEFTKEIIRSTETYRNFWIKKEVKEIVSLEKSQPEENPQIKKARENIKNFIKGKLKQESARLDKLKKENLSPEFDSFVSKIPQKKNDFDKKIPQLKVPRIEIPEPVLPWTVSDVRPFPSQERLYLGKLDPLVKDSLVKTIECDGPNEKITVTGAMGRKKTGITLSEEEVDFIIERFSKATKIPVSEGIFRVVYGKLSLSAVVSEVIGSRFIIKKMSLPPTQVPLRRY